ncbi:uncharacterized protein LOC133788318 [Humulus lupulus]|uniref:uncharacterized protein LOC133788318 n=1 Tax=Humulus lupulus TaxID=3486 RepID=UPI002B404B07|nr:uncharacterized protein LOC133788318 [Humulus lupulus]
MNQASSTKPNPNPIPSSNPNQNPSSLNNNARLATAECGNCGSPNRWVLHHVRIRGIHRRLCTTCVLRLHPSLFCPGCFQFYDSNNVPPPSKRLTCSKCSSFTHSHCAQPPTAPPTSSASASSSSSASYLCPACASPNFNFFDIDSEPNRAIDKRLALVLLCAAKISAASMTKAVIVARAEAERRVREAALARKRAKEALDNLAILFHSRGDKAMRKDVVGEGSAEVSGSRKTPLAQNSQVGKMFNGFTPPPRQSTVMLGSSQPSEKNDNREPKPVIDHHHHHRPTLQSNGNVYEKDKSAAMDVDKEKVKLEPKIQ